MATQNTLKTKILLLNGTQLEWDNLSDYVLSKGEPAVVYVPQANAYAESDPMVSVKIKVGDGVTKWQDLPYIGDEIQTDLDNRVDTLTARIEDAENAIESAGNAVFQIDATNLESVEGATEADKIATYITENVNEGNVAIVKKQITESTYSYTAYVYTTNKWVAMDGNYNAENVILNEDLTYTAPIGVKTVPSTGSGVINAKGKSIEEVLKSILAERATPSTTDPTVTLGSSNIGAKEVGTNIEIAYSFSTTKGSYSYDADTGVTFSGATATFNGETRNGVDGVFTSVQVKDDTKLSITGSIEQSAGIIPHDNLGDEYADGQIEAKSWTGLTKGTLTGYRAWFCGYKNGTNALTDATAITGAEVRALGNSANGSWKGEMNVAQMKQMFFAAPAGKGYKPSIKDKATTAPQTVLGPITVYVKGANNYMAAGAETTNGGMAYDVWYVNNADAASGSATLVIGKA